MNNLATAMALSLALLAFSPAKATDTVTYAYDARGRIASVTYSNGTTVVFTYDDANNLLVTTVTCSSGQGC